MSKKATSFKDLGKSTKDLLEKGFPVDTFEVESESTADNGAKLKVTASRNVKGEVSAGLEGPTYTWKDFGLTFKFIGKTENKGTFSLESSVEDKGVEGLKATLTAEQKGEDRTVKAAVDYKHPSTAVNTVLTYPLSAVGKPTFQGSAVAKYDRFSAGADAVVDLTETKVTKQNYKLAFEYSSKFNALAYYNIDKATVCGLALFSRVRDNVDLGVDVSQKLGGKDDVPTFKFATQYQLDKSSTLKAKFQSTDSRLAFALKQKLSDAVTATIATDLDASNLSSGSGHKFGLNLTINP